MTVAGDLSTFDLADLLQNMEAHGRTGTFTLRREEGVSRIFFRKGKVAMYAADGRAGFVDMLVAAGLVTSRRVEGALKKRPSGKKSLAETLVSRKVISAKKKGVT